ncbi:MAG: Zn-dependent hydrolase [Acidimicrobiaceae bacterium]|jgi:glyoxylase-like metal-dependent hydrolase (beta-lactamase superfamily II)|nr:Zn-dependent hydrolase [Acidimicrobiaceae bacterium]
MIELVTTAGIFSLDGQDFEVGNNVWLVGDEEEILVIDAAHDHGPIVAAAGGRRVVAIVATHGHNDHVNAAAALADEVGAPIWLHPADLELWHEVYPDREPDRLLADGAGLAVAGIDLQVLHTPGHTPGGCCLYAPRQDAVFSGDTLFNGGPGATGRRFSDFPTIVESIRDRLFVLPDETKVLPGHGAGTTIGAERSHLGEWIERGS